MRSILLFLHASLKIAIQLIQCETHYLKRFLKCILMCKFWCGSKYKTHIPPWRGFPTHCSFCTGSSKAGGLREINPVINPESCSPSSIRPRQGRITRAVLVLGINTRVWQAELFIWLLAYSKFIFSYFARRQDTKIERENKKTIHKQTKLKINYKINSKTTHTHNKTH